MRVSPDATVRGADWLKSLEDLALSAPAGEDPEVWAKRLWGHDITIPPPRAARAIRAAERLRFWSEDQPRDPDGRFASGGGATAPAADAQAIKDTMMQGHSWEYAYNRAHPELAAAGLDSHIEWPWSGTRPAGHADDPRLTNAQRSALNTFSLPEEMNPQNITAKDVNSYLRHGVLNGTASRDQVRGVVQAIDSAIRANTFDQETEAWRGIASGALPPGDPKDLVGRTFTDWGFPTVQVNDNALAVAMPPREGTGRVQQGDNPILHITIPEGAHGVQNNGADDYEEAVLPRGSTFRVDSVEGRTPILIDDPWMGSVEAPVQTPREPGEPITGWPHTEIDPETGIEHEVPGTVVSWGRPIINVTLVLPK